MMFHQHLEREGNLFWQTKPHGVVINKHELRPSKKRDSKYVPLLPNGKTTKQTDENICSTNKWGYHLISNKSTCGLCVIFCFGPQDHCQLAGLSWVFRNIDVDSSLFVWLTHEYQGEYDTKRRRKSVCLSTIDQKRVVPKMGDPKVLCHHVPSRAGATTLIPWKFLNASSKHLLGRCEWTCKSFQQLQLWPFISYKYL